MSNKFFYSIRNIIDEQEQSNRNKPSTSENSNTTHPNNVKKTVTQEQKLNLENLKRTTA